MFGPRSKDLFSLDANDRLVQKFIDLRLTEKTNSEAWFLLRGAWFGIVKEIGGKSV